MKNKNIFKHKNQIYFLISPSIKIFNELCNKLPKNNIYSIPENMPIFFYISSRYKPVAVWDNNIYYKMKIWLIDNKYAFKTEKEMLKHEFINL